MSISFRRNQPVIQYVPTANDNPRLDMNNNINTSVKNWGNWVPRTLSLSTNSTSTNWDKCRMLDFKKYLPNAYNKEFFISHQLWMKEICYQREALLQEVTAFKCPTWTKLGSIFLKIGLTRWGGLSILPKLVARKQILIKLIKWLDFSSEG